MGVVIDVRKFASRAGVAGWYRKTGRSPGLVLMIEVAIVVGVVLLPGCGGVHKEVPVERVPRKRESEPAVTVASPTVTVVFDNNRYKEGLTTSWGFSCLVTGMEKTILFDTGGSPSVLSANMDLLGIDPAGIDIVVLSHNHGDHVGGLGSVLEKNPGITVYLPASFPTDFKGAVRGYGAGVVEVSEPLRICEDVHSTGELGAAVREQSLVIETEKGLVVITGCAHPGIIEIVEKAKELFDDDVLLVMGGFHLGGVNVGRLESIVSGFQELGVACVGPCHCSGDEARRLFQQAYGDEYIDVGVGTVIDTGELSRQVGSVP